MSPFTIINKTKGKPPRLPFSHIKEKIVGEDYDLSLIFIGSKTSRTLNKNYRKKDKPADILSFPLSRSEGEIFIDLSQSKKRAPEYDRSYKGFVGFLFIHGLLHLKGFEHSSKMEREEKKFCKIFSI